jgi:hypothetical protein
MSVYSSTNRSGSTHSSGSAFRIRNQDPQSGSTIRSGSTYGSGSAIRSEYSTYRIKTFDEKVKEIEQKFIKDTRVQEAEFQKNLAIFEQKFIKDTRVQEAEFQKNLAIIEQKYTEDTAEQERAYRRAIKKLRGKESHQYFHVSPR